MAYVQAYVTFVSVEAADSAFKQFPSKVSRDSGGLMAKTVRVEPAGKCVRIRRMQGHNGNTLQPARSAKIQKVSADGP